MGWAPSWRLFLCQEGQKKIAKRQPRSTWRYDKTNPQKGPEFKEMDLPTGLSPELMFKTLTVNQGREPASTLGVAGDYLFDSV